MRCEEAPAGAVECQSGTRGRSACRSRISRAASRLFSGRCMLGAGACIAEYRSPAPVASAYSREVSIAPSIGCSILARLIWLPGTLDVFASAAPEDWPNKGNSKAKATQRRIKKNS